MTDFHLAALLLPACAAFGTGVLLGASYFLTLRWNVRVLALGNAPPCAIGLQLARFALLAAALVLIVRGLGALPLIAATAGIITARAAVLRMGAVA